MRTLSRRWLLSTLGAGLPFTLVARAEASGCRGPTLRFRSFEDSVRSAFAAPGAGGRRCLEVGDSDRVRAGVQGCYNDRPFAGFEAGRLRIVRTGSAPGPSFGGVRLYVTTVDVFLDPGPPRVGEGRPLDFSTLPPAPIFS